MVELNPTVREQEIYEEMELTPEMVKSIRTLCATCLRHFVESEVKSVPFGHRYIGVQIKGLYP